MTSLSLRSRHHCFTLSVNSSDLQREYILPNHLTQPAIHLNPDQIKESPRPPQRNFLNLNLSPCLTLATLGKSLKRFILTNSSCKKQLKRSFMRSWARGTVGPWVRGSVGPWVRGSVGLWVRGSVGLWVCDAFFFSKWGIKVNSS